MFDQLLKLYETHSNLWNLEKAGNFDSHLSLERIYRLLNIRRNDKKYQYYVKFLKTLKNKPVTKDLLIDLVQYYISKN